VTGRACAVRLLPVPPQASESQAAGAPFCLEARAHSTVV
jgi:hypothetical protein